MDRVDRRARLAVMGALFTAVLLALPPASASPARPGAAGPCRDATGVTVVVDASAFGGGIQVRCAAQPVRSGFDALTRAGFTYLGSAQFPGLLCRIDGEPASDPCQGAPPSKAYWAYWHAPRGGEWSYSTSGAGSRVPPPGSVEGWAFGDRKVPGASPPAPTPTTTTTTPAATATTRPAGGAGGGAVAPSPGATTSSTAAPGAGSPPTSPGDVTSSTTEPDGVPDGDGGSGEPLVGDSTDELAAAVDEPEGGSGGAGSPHGALAGVGIAAGLAAVALVSARRRRDPAGEGPP